MTELESLSAQLEAAVKMQANAERLYHKSAEKIEKLKMQMLEVKKKNRPKAAKVEELFAAHDYRTREMHRLLDQQTAELDEPFKVMGYEIQRPGDPNAAPEMVYHCRCVLSSALGKYPRQNAMQRDNVTKETTPVMDYTEWYKAKGGKEKEQMWWAEERKRKKEQK